MNAIGVDVGGTKIAAAVVTPGGEILNEVRYPTQAVPPNRLVATIAEAISEVKDSHEVGGVCLAVPGLIMSSINTVIFAPNLHEIENIRLDEEIGGRTGMSITVENDANAAAWGEFRYGSGKDVDHQIFITLGTGVGGGVINHGVLLRGAQGAGGELGHVTLGPNGPALRLRQPRLPGGPRLRHRHRPPGKGGRQRKATLGAGPARIRAAGARGGRDGVGPGR